MKRIRIFGKELYILNVKEHYDLIDSYAGIKSGVNNANWQLQLAKQYRENTDKFDFCMKAAEDCLEFANRHIDKFLKALD